MSWDAYIDNVISRSRDSKGVVHCDRVCIIGLQGGSSWTSLTHPRALKIHQKEAAQIAGCMKSKNFSKFQSNGVVVGGERYLFLRSQDGKVTYAKKKGRGGLTIHATKRAVIIAHCPEGKQQGTVNKGTGQIADYLVSANM